MSLFYTITLFILILLVVFFIYLGKYIKRLDESYECSKDSISESDGRYKFLGDNWERPSFFRRIYLKWNFEWRHLPRDVMIGFKNLFQWFRIIWSDRHWDHTYLLHMMKFKIEKMADYHESRQFYVGWENNVKWMRTSCKLIDKLIDGYYDGEPSDYYDLEMRCVPEEDSDFTKWLKNLGLNENGELNGFFIRFETKNEHIDDYLDKYPLQIDKVKRQYKELRGEDIDLTNVDHRKYFSTLLSYHNQKRCQTLLFKILNEKLQHWWD